MSYRSAVVFLLLFLAGSGAARPKSTQVSYGVMGCTHIGDLGVQDYDGGVNSNLDAIQHMVEWLCDQGISRLFVVGDATLRTENWSDSGYFKKFMDTHVAEGVELRLVAGNHDTFLFDDPLNQGANPYAHLPDSFPQFAEGGSYWHEDVGSVRFISLNNNDDYVVFTGSSYSQPYYSNNPPYYGLTYWNSNGYPTGNDSYYNPSFGGITRRSSHQYQWLRSLLLDRDYTWTILFAHRAVFSPQNPAVFVSRRCNTDMRTTSSLGVDLMHTADQHIAYGLDRVNSTAAGDVVVRSPDSLGIHYYGVCGAYVRRDTDVASAPAGSVYFANAADVDSGVTCKWIYANLVDITGNRARVRVVRSAQGPSPGYQLRIVVEDDRAFLSQGAKQ